MLSKFVPNYRRTATVEEQLVRREEDNVPSDHSLHSSSSDVEVHDPPAPHRRSHAPSRPHSPTNSRNTKKRIAQWVAVADPHNRSLSNSHHVRFIHCELRTLVILEDKRTLHCRSSEFGSSKSNRLQEVRRGRRPLPSIFDREIDTPHWASTDQAQYATSTGPGHNRVAPNFQPWAYAAQGQEQYVFRPNPNGHAHQNFRCHQGVPIARALRASPLNSPRRNRRQPRRIAPNFNPPDPSDYSSSPSPPQGRKIFECGLSHSYAAQGDKTLSKLTALAVNDRRFERNIESAAVLANQGVITQLSEQISTLNERMDEFTSWIEELNSKFVRKTPTSHQNLAPQAEACNGSAPTSLFIAGLGNGSLLPSSSSSSQLTKESPLIEEIMVLARGQRQLMHQLDNLSNFVHESWGEINQEVRTDRRSRIADFEFIGIPFILTLAFGGVGMLLYKGLSSRS
ncbi:hypothetical protein IFM89_003336 [Coptis chinensis]|uniref:Uncharacterized protein n=1 Tax=Coptis chinensis TaxID=261450 RepID=A0A835MH49_9MAGN|nr:hypothetical protein IFM89_003336 [Coptis chinensis]